MSFYKVRPYMLEGKCFYVTYTLILIWIFLFVNGLYLYYRPVNVKLEERVLVLEKDNKLLRERYMQLILLLTHVSLKSGEVINLALCNLKK